jgi:hypothetical protein
MVRTQFGKTILKVNLTHLIELNAFWNTMF